MPTVTVPEAALAIGGFGTACLINFGARKPLYTGIYKHAVLTVAGFYLGRTLDKWHYQKQQEKLVILEDYVRLHPEDFPQEAPKKYKDILFPWVPVR